MGKIDDILKIQAEQIRFLSTQNKQLISENSQLRNLLIQNNINIPQSNVNAASFTPIASPTSNAETMISNQIIIRVMHYFAGNPNVYAQRFYNRKNNSSGYSPQCENLFAPDCPKSLGQKQPCASCPYKKWKKLTISTVRNHILGKDPEAQDVIGIYVMHPDNTVRFIVFDFDDHDYDENSEKMTWIEEVNMIADIVKANGIDYRVERSRSGHGAHLWIFFSEPIEASMARRFGNGLISMTLQRYKKARFSFFDRLFPLQETLKENQLGNLIALPFQGQAMRNNNSVFIDELGNPLPRQLQSLFQVHRYSATEIQAYLDQWKIKPTDTKGKNDVVLPWKKQTKFNPADINGTLDITISNQIYIDTSNCKSRLVNQLKQLAVYKNVDFYRALRSGRSIHGKSRFIDLSDYEDPFLVLPRGCLDQLTELLELSDITYTVNDETCEGCPIDVEFKGELDAKQTDIINVLADYDTGIIVSPTATGKTVMGCALIGMLKVNTLVLVPTTSVMDAWCEELDNHLKCHLTNPSYLTKTGRKKQLKTFYGSYKDQKNHCGGIVDIAMISSMIHKDGTVFERLNDYGCIIVDECQHVAAQTYTEVIRHIDSKYLYGLTATKKRGDGLSKTLPLLLGPLRYEIKEIEKTRSQPHQVLVNPRFTRVLSLENDSKYHYTSMLVELSKNELRNQQILKDIKACMADGKSTPLVLSRFKEQIHWFYDRLKQDYDHVFILDGDTKVKERDEIIKTMKSLPLDQPMILLGTNSMIGEGFNFPRLDTLFMATPLSYDHVTTQNVGRINRIFDGKTKAMIYDYVDYHLPLFNAIYLKRLRLYHRNGYTILSNGHDHDESYSFIYNSLNYESDLKKDFSNASKSVVMITTLSDPDRNNIWMLPFNTMMDHGVTITILTTTDSLDNRLIQSFNDLGISIKYIESTMTPCVIVDHETIWFGGLDLLGTKQSNTIIRFQNMELANEVEHLV